MLRINLLPPYVAQRRQVRMLWAVFSLAWIVLAVLGIGWYLTLLPKVSNETQMANDAQNAHTQYDTLNSQAQSISSAAGPILAKVGFYNKVLTYNTQAPNLYGRVARWTSPAVYYTDMNISGNTLDIKGFTKSIADLGRYLQYMYTEPDISSVALTSALPSYSQAVVPVILYRGHPVQQPTQTQGFGGQPGAYGGPPNFGPGGPGGFVPPGAYGAPAGYGAPGGFGGRGGMRNFGGAQNQAGANGPSADVIQLAEQHKGGYSIGYRHIDSFDFDVQCTLKQALSPPQPPSGGGGAGAGGANAATTGAGAMG